MAKRLQMLVELLPAIVHCPVMIDVGEKLPLKIIQTFYCNGTGADRLVYGKGDYATISAKLIAHLTPEMAANIQREHL